MTSHYAHRDRPVRTRDLGVRNLGKTAMTTYQTPPPPGWSPHTWARPEPAPAPTSYRPAPGPSRLAVVAVVLASLALLLAVAAGVAVLVGGSGSGNDGGGGSGWDAPLTGRLDAAPKGALGGGTLQSAVSKVIIEDGGGVTQLTCPATPSVAQGVVTVCHATIDGDPWAVVVLFEDTDGSFTLDLI
ncbi:DUF4333 domain-containing protein [uncultured Friedmanniella sp.]|uniref:DUF4333 domain-containing protein n=1 Tax=uncultured Friedmanniella sp. TaxID=335381 RepID=UPI0035CB1ADC